MAFADVLKALPSRRSAEASDRFASEITEAQTTRLFHQVQGNFVANLICTIAFLWVFLSMVPLATILLWAGYAQAVNLSGMALVRARKKNKNQHSNQHWLRLFSFYGAADALTWGGAAFIFFTPDSPLHSLFLIAILLGNVAGGTTSFVSYLPVMLTFDALILGPLALRFGFAGENVFYALAGLTFLYGGTMVNLGVRFHKNLMMSWRLQFELQASEGALRESRDSLEVRVAERTQQLREANDDLKKSEALYRAVVEVQTELLCRFMPGGRLTFANDAFCRFFNADRASLIDSEFLTSDQKSALWPPSEAEKILRCVASLTPSQPTGTCETCVPGPDGKERWLMWTHRALFEQDGRAMEYQSVAIDITQRKAAEDRIEFIAHHDALTELPNRLLFQKHLEQTLNAPRQAHESTAILLFDLDDFKHVNDALGHYYGDMLLREMAKRLQACMRDGDMVARLGGDEFGVIMTRVGSASDIAAMAERALEQLDRPVAIDGHMVGVGASAGITQYPSDSDDPGRLLKNADLALYRAKNKGRATYEFYSQDLANHAERRLELISGLRDALEKDQLHLVYQPKIKLDDGRTIGSEALLRWVHPEEGLISPDEFIPVAETAGLSVAIGDWVLRQVCCQLSDWRSEGLPLLSVSVNLSATQFTDRSLIEKVNKTLTEFSIDPALIEFEITETAIMNDLDLAIEMMQGLVNLGSQLSIDDFGTGYSSFGYLRRLPITELKIDRSFVMGIVDSHEDRAILRAMVDLGHSLDLKVLSEGVETQEQYDLLNSIECDHAQGFLMSRPIAADVFAEKLRSNPHAGQNKTLAPPQPVLATTDT